MNTDRLFTGAVLVGLGVLFLLSANDIVEAGTVIARGWPLLIVAVGIRNAVGTRRDVTGGLVTMILGLALLTVTAGLWSWAALWSWWPLLLIGAGLWLLLRHSSGEHTVAARADVASENRVEVVTVLSGRDVRVNAPAFQRGTVTAILGGVKVDLRDATLADDGARMSVTALLGGAELLVPEDWSVRVSGPAILGGVDDHTGGVRPGRPLLEVDVFTLLGGVEIKPVVVPAVVTAAG